MTDPEITVIIPAHNAGDTLPDTLAGLRGQRGAEASEVIVVDDGSADETASIAERSPIVDRVIRLHGIGPGRARNAGAAAARADRLAFLDADCRPTERWLATGSAELESAAVSHPAVREAAAIGVPHAVKGETAWIFCCLLPGYEPTPELAAEILEYCATRLAKFKTPKSIDFTDAMPRDPNGKLYKRKLRDPYWEGRERAI